MVIFQTCWALSNSQLLGQGILKGKYHCTVDCFDWFWISCMTTDNFCICLQNRLIQTSQTGGQKYSDTSPFSIPWFGSSSQIRRVAIYRISWVPSSKTGLPATPSTTASASTNLKTDRWGSPGDCVMLVALQVSYPGALFTKLCFHRNLQMGPISYYSVVIIV